MSDDRAGEELARAWLQGKSELVDDLAALVDGMDKPLGATARAFLLTVGNAARQAARGHTRPKPAGATRPVEALPLPEAPPVDIDAFRRRWRERERAARLEQLSRDNSATPSSPGRHCFGEPHSRRYAARSYAADPQRLVIAICVSVRANASR
jgi:hypothetical protein